MLLFMAKHLGTQKSFRFSDEELAVLEAAKDKHGTYKDALMAALRREAGANDLTQAQVIDWVRKHSKSD